MEEEDEKGQRVSEQKEWEEEGKGEEVEDEAESNRGGRGSRREEEEEEEDWNSLFSFPVSAKGNLLFIF